MRFLFLPEIGRSLAEIGGASRRIAAMAGGLRLRRRDRPIDWRRLLDRRMRARAIVGVVLILAGIIIALATGPVSAQTAVVSRIRSIEAQAIFPH